MVCVREHWAAGIAAWAVVLGLVCESALGREVKLTICPQKMSAEAGTYSLLPPQASLTDGDAVALYDKAIKALPDKKTDNQIHQWLNMPVDRSPADQIEKVVTQYIESLKCVAKAVKCRECRWSPKPGMEVANSEEYRRLTFGVRLWARLELSNAQYEGAILALQTGFGMARQVGQAPSPAQAELGGMIAQVMCSEVEQLVQIDGSPNLYAALAALPKPFTDVEGIIEADKKATPSEPPAGMTRAQFESVLRRLQKQYDRVRIFGKRLDTDLAALQSVEAIRSYAASHGGQLPQTLVEITEVSVPKDPVSGAAFRYTRTGATAVLESAMAPGGDAQDVMRYEITMKN